jgi:hypothetical protein
VYEPCAVASSKKLDVCDLFEVSTDFWLSRAVRAEHEPYTGNYSMLDGWVTQALVEKRHTKKEKRTNSPLS